MRSARRLGLTGQRWLVQPEKCAKRKTFQNPQNPAPTRAQAGVLAETEDLPKPIKLLRGRVSVTSLEPRAQVRQGPEGK